MRSVRIEVGVPAARSTPETRPGSQAGKAEYAQAGSTDPALMAAAQEMMAGDPLDAPAEVRARAAGWQR